ncbi:MAG: undecaprenyl diphosphate synthase family protein [Candidatus Levyibacteriota bacterium]
MPAIEHIRNTAAALKDPRGETRKWTLLAHDAIGKAGDAVFYSDVRQSRELRGFTDDEIASSIGHIAVILDRNRTFVKDRKIPSERAHELGAKRVVDLLDDFSSLPIPHISLWGFSVSNWGRKPGERDRIFSEIAKTLDTIQDKLREKNIRFRHIGYDKPHMAQVGNKDGATTTGVVQLPDYLLKKFEDFEEMTMYNTGQNLNLLIDYNIEYERYAREGTCVTGEEILRLPDGYVLKPADLVLRTGENERHGIHTSAFGMIQEGQNTTIRGIKTPLPALRRKEIVRAVQAKLQTTLNGGK